MVDDEQGMLESELTVFPDLSGNQGAGQSSAMLIINSRQWELKEHLGSGGYGHVYAAESNGEQAAIKMVPKERNTSRELLIADDLAGMPNVVPFTGIGETVDAWALLMPRAEMSLRQHITASGRSLDHAEVSQILIDIAGALTALATKGIVHRDIKPENVLMVDGSWCLADFGIARYAEATTATDTFKYSTTRPYMAPEQWREETATSASDVYAFGVIAYELATGVRPFNGPNFRQQHLHDRPAPVTGLPATVCTLIGSCLFKPPGARPAASSLIELLCERPGETWEKEDNPGFTALARAAHNEVERQVEMQTAESQRKIEREYRANFSSIAEEKLLFISKRIREAISRSAPAFNHLASWPGIEWTAFLGSAKMWFSGIVTEPLAYDSKREANPIDPVACCTLAVGNRPCTSEYCGRGHSLIFCDPMQRGQYDWYETAFIRSIPSEIGSFRRCGDYWDYLGSGLDRRFIYAPFALVIWGSDMAGLFRGEVGEYKVGWPLTRLDSAGLPSFIDRWIGWFADAARQELSPPAKMPELDPKGSWIMTPRTAKQAH